MQRAARPIDDGDEDLDLPALDDGSLDDEPDAEADEELELPLVAEAIDDDEAPVDIAEPILTPTAGAPSGADDEEEGPADPTFADAMPLEIGQGSLLDDGSEGASADDDAVGIEPMPEGGDRTDANGLDDPMAERVVEQPLPQLDEGDDEPIDVGITLDPDDSPRRDEP